MIVNPQLFNYRLITGSLVVTVAVLSIISFTNYQSEQARQLSIEQEKKLIEIELSQMIRQYDEVSLDNSLIASQLETSKRETQDLLDSIQILQSETSEVSKFKRKVVDLQVRNNTLLSRFNVVNLKNAELEKEKLKVNKELENQRQINNTILNENKKLNERLKMASLLTASSFKATALNKTLGKTVETSKASKTESIEVSFTLGENMLVEEGEKDIYIQILTPENNVFADKGAVNFGESSLIYSTKKIIAYNNGALDISILINAEDDDRPLIEGNYYISVFNNDRKLGGTQLQLD